MVFLNCSLRLLNADKNLQLKQCQENTCKVEVIDHSRIVENPETHQLKFYRKKNDKRFIARFIKLLFRSFT